MRVAGSGEPASRLCFTKYAPQLRRLSPQLPVARGSAVGLVPEAMAREGVGTAREMVRVRARVRETGMGREPGEPQGWGMALALAPGWATALALAPGWATALAPAPGWATAPALGWVTAPAPGQAERALARGWGWETAPAPGMGRAPQAWAMGPQPTQAAVIAAAQVLTVAHSTYTYDNKPPQQAEPCRVCNAPNKSSPASNHAPVLLHLRRPGEAAAIHPAWQQHKAAEEGSGQAVHPLCVCWHVIGTLHTSRLPAVQRL